MREATVINQKNGTPFLDMDPVDLEVRSDGTADPRDENLIRIFETMLDAEAEINIGLVLLLVWTDTLYTEPVRINCPVCGNSTRVDDESAPEDMRDGTIAMVCCSCLD